MGLFTFNVPVKYLEHPHEAESIESALKALAIQRGIRFGVTIAIFLGVVLSYGCPHYNVWQQGLSGSAKLAEAEQSRQITIQEAKALEESAKHKAQAEIIRAEGAAKANKIISEGLGGPEGYLRYLWIDSLTHRSGDTIYVPTEAGLPILAPNRVIK